MFENSTVNIDPSSLDTLHIVLLTGISYYKGVMNLFNPLTPIVNSSGRTAPLASKVAFYIFIQ